MMMPIATKKQIWGSWSKYGGANYGLYKNEDPQWYCQICKQVQARVLPQWMIAMDEDRVDFIRVCSKCKRHSIKLQIERAVELIKAIRRLTRGR